MSSEPRMVIVPGRIVWTVAQSLFEGKGKTVQGTNTPVLDQKTGLQAIEYGFGLAVEKAALSDPSRAGGFWAAIHEEAYTFFPNRQIPPTFSMKYKDGDGLDHNGKPFSLREGHAGCLIFAMKTQLPIRFFHWDGTQNIQVEKGIKCGDYVNVQVRIKGHMAQNNQGKSGLYLNPLMVQLAAEGKAIINAPSGNQVFGMGAPTAPTNIVAPEVPTMPAAPLAAVPQPGQFPAPGVAATPLAAPMPPSTAIPASPQPHMGVIPPHLQPQVQQHVQMPAMPPLPGVPR